MQVCKGQTLDEKYAKTHYILLMLPLTLLTKEIGVCQSSEE